MPVSNVQNPAVAKYQENQQSVASTADQTPQQRSDLSSGANQSGSRFEDNVTLSKSSTELSSDRVSEVDTDSVPTDSEAAEKLLKQAMDSGMADTQVAVSSQSQVSAESAKALLADA